MDKFARAKLDLDGGSPGQPVTPLNGGARTPAAQTADVVDMGDFLAAAGGDFGAALAAAVAALPTGGRIDIPYGTYPEAHCQTITTNHSLIIAGAGHGATIVTQQQDGCVALTIHEGEVNRVIRVNGVDFVPAPNVVAPGGLTVTLPVTLATEPLPAGAVVNQRLNGSAAQQNLVIDDVHILSTPGDMTGYYTGGMTISGAWRALVRNSGVACRSGRPAAPPANTPTERAAGFSFGEVEQATFDNDRADACYYGWAQTDYSEGVTIRSPQGVGNQVGVFVPTSVHPVNGFDLDQITIEGGELSAFLSPIFFAGSVIEGFVHDNHLLALADTNVAAAAATSCPTTNAAGQYVMSFNGLQASHVHDNQIDGGIYQLRNGTRCTYATGGIYLGGVSANDAVHDDTYQYLGASVDLGPPSLNNRVTDEDTSTIPSTGTAYIDDGTAGQNVVTYRFGNRISSLH